MKITLDVENCDEGDSLKTALADPEVRAFTLVMGTLLALPPRVRERILMFVSDAVTEEIERLDDLEEEEESR